MSLTTPLSILSSEEVQKLENEYGILHLIYHRDHNQHHVAVWWKDLNQLHRCIRKILRKIYEFEETKKHVIKQRLHAETLALARSMIKTRLFTRCYYSFNGIIALGQFVTLGLTLVGSLSALYALTMKIRGLTDTLASITLKTSLGNSKRISGVPETALDDDLGEEILFEEKPTVVKNQEGEAMRKPHEPAPKRKLDDIESIFGDKPKKKKKEKKEKKPKEKKKKSAIDDIFG